MFSRDNKVTTQNNSNYHCVMCHLWSSRWFGRK